MEPSPIFRLDRRRTAVLLAAAALAAIPFGVAAANEPERHRACGTVSARAFVEDDATSFDLPPWTEDFRRVFALPEVTDAALVAAGTTADDLELTIAEPVAGATSVEVCARASSGTVASVAVVEAATRAVLRLTTEQADRDRLVERERLRQLDGILDDDPLRLRITEELYTDALTDRMRSEARLLALEGTAALAVADLEPVDPRPAVVRAGLTGALGAALAVTGIFVTVDLARRRPGH